MVAVNPSTGEVFQYFDSRRDYAQPPTATIDAAQGIKIAEALVEGARASTVKFTELTIAFSASGEQSLVWEVGLTAENAGGWTDAYIVHVDALSGQATIFAQG